MLRLSTLFGRTLREDPADAETPGHRLLLRAGYIRRVAPGIHSWLPLGLKVLDRVGSVGREEMDRIGGQEVLLPALVPAEPYELSGRAAGYGDLVFRLKDRRGTDCLLAPADEELFTILVKGECSSYRDLPVTLYQVQAKYRDEPRPHGGVLRGREFQMLDSCSFDLDDAGRQRSYDLHRGAFQRIFERLGLEHHIVVAAGGAMGGPAGEEFVVPSPSGEDTFVVCAACGYKATTEAAEISVPPPADPHRHPPLEVLDTPGTPTIAALVAAMGAAGVAVDAAGTLKNVVFTLRRPDGRTETLVVGVPGDREVDPGRLGAQVAPAEVVPADVDTVPGLVKGYIGPQGLPEGVRYVVDPLVTAGSAWVTGANQPGRHAVNVVMGRDFQPAGTVAAAGLRQGDLCARCRSSLAIDRGIGIGHIFRLGGTYADVSRLDVSGPDGRPVRVTMGSYRLGVSRAVAAIAEQSHDDRGLIWPRVVAPADVHIIAIGRDGQLEAAEQLAGAVEHTGRGVLLDDRGASPGVAFKDAELIGIPTIVVVGRALGRGLVELRDRRTGTVVEIPIDAARQAILAEAGAITLL